jgi:ribonuclease P protein component
VTDRGFEKLFRLLSVRDFSELKVDSFSFKKPSLIIYYKRNSLNQTRIGLSLPKKIGKAHDRNRLKRILRETFRTSNYKYLGFDILLVVSWNRSLFSESQEFKEQSLKNNLEEFFIYLKKQLERSQNLNTQSLKSP